MKESLQLNKSATNGMIVITAQFPNRSRHSRMAQVKFLKAVFQKFYLVHSWILDPNVPHKKQTKQNQNKKTKMNKIRTCEIYNFCFVSQVEWEIRSKESTLI